MWYCYILRNKLDQYKNCTYNGSTNNPIRRLRQHNEEICGGARATHGKGGAWEICAMLSGFHDHINCLSCEWRMKCPSGRPGKRDNKYRGTEGRIRSLNEILPLERWTGKCVIDNSTCIYKLHILDEFAHVINKNVIPKNIEIISVPTIDATCIELEKDIYTEID